MLIMSLLARAKLCSKKCPFSLYPIAALQQLNFYSTRTTHFSQKSQQLTNPRTQKSSESSSSFSRRTKETGSLPVWPKPNEIPYQAKVANFVNLIGCVKSPVRFEASSDGKHFAITLVSQGNSGERNSLLVPVVFEGDLAHVVACHVNENDYVFVSGPLSVGQLPFESGDGLGKFHIVAENLNFVEGFKRNVSSKKKIGVSFSSVEIEKPEAKKIEEGVKRVEIDEDFSKQWKDALRARAESLLSEKKDSKSSVTQESSAIPKLNMDVKAITSESVESKQEKGIEKSVESAYKKKDGDQILDLWRDLVKNPLQWWDYRDHKSNGLVKEKFPDFKHKGRGDSLWLNTAPDWLLPGLAKLEFDVKVIKTKQVQDSEGSGQRKSDGRGEDSWRNLVEYPSKWWDNRLNKRYPKSPDFKNKDTGEGLWLGNMPDWALSRLPPLKDDKKNAETVQSI